MFSTLTGALAPAQTPYPPPHPAPGHGEEAPVSPESLKAHSPSAGRTGPCDRLVAPSEAFPHHVGQLQPPPLSTLRLLRGLSGHSLCPGHFPRPSAHGFFPGPRSRACANLQSQLPTPRERLLRGKRKEEASNDNLQSVIHGVFQFAPPMS